MLLIGKIRDSWKWKRAQPCNRRAPQVFCGPAGLEPGAEARCLHGPVRQSRQALGSAFNRTGALNMPTPPSRLAGFSAGIAQDGEITFQLSRADKTTATFSVAF